MQLQQSKLVSLFSVQRTCRLDAHNLREGMGIPSWPSPSRGGCCEGDRVSRWLCSGLLSVVLNHGTGSWCGTIAVWVPLQGGWPLWPPPSRGGPDVCLGNPGSGWHRRMLPWCLEAEIIQVVGGKCGLVHPLFVGLGSVTVVLEEGRWSWAQTWMLSLANWLAW